jgi:hypothetical protein
LEKSAKGSTPKAWLYGLTGWLLPGFGHLGQGRVVKGLLGGAVIIAAFIIGASLGGHIYALRDSSEGLLSSLFGFCDMGSGILYLSSKTLGIALSEQPERATSEYGNVFIMVAGLLNFILALDAFDIGVGRKS